jgi:hypothetical protein
MKFESEEFLIIKKFVFRKFIENISVLFTRFQNNETNWSDLIKIASEMIRNKNDDKIVYRNPFPLIQ